MLEQFEKYHLFRRLVIVFFLSMYALVTRETIEYAYYAAYRGISAGDTVLVIGSIQALVTLIVGYAFKIYSASIKT